MVRNPFLTQIQTKELKTSERLNSDINDNSVTTIELHTSKTTDVGSYIKIYIAFIPIKRLLSATAKEIVEYIIEHLSYEDDVVIIPNFLFTSSRTKTRILAELKSNNIISHITKERYYINPTYMFRGNRIKFLNKNK